MSKFIDLTHSTGEITSMASCWHSESFQNSELYSDRVNCHEKRKQHVISMITPTDHHPSGILNWFFGPTMVLVICKYRCSISQSYSSLVQTSEGGDPHYFNELSHAFDTKSVRVEINFHQ